MTQNKNLMVIGLVLLGLLIWSSMFIVDQRERAILFRLGEIVHSDFAPGLHFKIPVINNVRKFDGRILTMDSQPERYLTSEKKNVIVDSFVKWRIKDVATFYRSTGGDERLASTRLSQIIKDMLRAEFAKRTIQEVVAGDRTQIMDVLSSQATMAVSDLGIDVVDVRIKRIDLPTDVSDSVYQRMRAERARVAKDFRSRGEERAIRIRAEADRERTVLLAEAYRDAERLRGEGDASAAEIYAKAFERDEEFYSLYRSLQAYRSSFTGPEDVLLLKPDSDFFRYFNNLQGTETGNP
ncbi:MAG: protease modulator HflC [Chromatiales bacterium]|nr:protease modulator HflC [Gammaproteobacteria bacterium]MCP5230784.1 protease modulator HflC [Zoogloeaceae bacterium]MCP5351918.1 protease modulator HflC [Chromatiales bacterium]